jgi:saccharopine dehydrogenase-like NADP-dependent oxidoreductase
LANTSFYLKIGSKQRRARILKKILVLGGVGAMANETTRDLVETSNFDEIMVADINIEKVNDFITELGDKRLKSVRIDAKDISAMPSGLPSKREWIIWI